MILKLIRVSSVALTHPGVVPVLYSAVAVSTCGSPTSFVSVGGVMFIRASQRKKLPIAKSLSLAVGSWEERDSAKKLEKQTTSSGKKWLTFNVPSKKSNSEMFPVLPSLSINGQGELIVVSLLTIPQTSTLGLELLHLSPEPRSSKLFVSDIFQL